MCIAISDAQMIIDCIHAHVGMCDALTTSKCAYVTNILSRKIGCQDNANNMRHYT